MARSKSERARADWIREVFGKVRMAIESVVTKCRQREWNGTSSVG